MSLVCFPAILAVQSSRRFKADCEERREKRNSDHDWCADRCVAHQGKQHGKHHARDRHGERDKNDDHANHFGSLVNARSAFEPQFLGGGWEPSFNVSVNTTHLLVMSRSFVLQASKSNRAAGHMPIG